MIGSQSLLTPKQREVAADRGDTARTAAVQYREARKAGGDATEKILAAQRARAERLKREYDGEYATTGGGGVTNIALEAQFAQLERRGEFKNLAGVGKPLPERQHTHFGDEDAADRLMSRIMAENNVKPESVVLRSEFMARLKAFRQELAQAASAAERAGKTLSRAGFEFELQELRVLRKAFDDASLKDTFTFQGLPIRKLPVVVSLDEELTKLHPPSKH